MVRVLQCIASLGRGGAESLVYNIYSNIDRSKIQFDFAVYKITDDGYEEEIKKLGGKIYKLKSRFEGIFMQRKTWDSFFKEHNEYDVVHLHCSSLTDITPLIFARKYGIKKRIIHCHSTNQEGVMHKILHRLNGYRIHKFATEYLCCSEQAGKWMYGKTKVFSEKIFKINNSIDVKKYLYNYQERNKVRNELNIQGKYVVGHVGRFMHVKNHEFIIDIFKEIKTINNDAMLMLVGTGILEDQMKRKVEQLQINDSVLFLGTRANVNELLQAMDVFLFPSHYEGLPLTLIEAQCSGLKCFISDNITDEVNISDLITKISLEQNAKFWARAIINTKDYERSNMYDGIRKAGYDIDNTIKFLEKIYLK